MGSLQAAPKPPAAPKATARKPAVPKAVPEKKARMGDVNAIDEQSGGFNGKIIEVWDLNDVTQG